MSSANETPIADLQLAFEIHLIFLLNFICDILSKPGTFGLSLKLYVCMLLFYCWQLIPNATYVRWQLHVMEFNAKFCLYT